MKPAIVIPLYNHGANVTGVVRCAQPLGFPILVVDDGSTDGCAAGLEHLTGVTVLRHPVNQGKGAALLTGMAAAWEQERDWAICIDADGQHNPADIPALLAAARNSGRRPLIIGHRQGMQDNVNVPWTSRFGRGFSNFWVWCSGGPRVRDSQSGFRLYPLPETLCLGVLARRYQFEVEVLVRAARRGIPVLEEAVSVVYQNPGERISHFRPWRDFLRNSTTFSRLIAERIAAWPWAVCRRLFRL